MRPDNRYYLVRDVTIPGHGTEVASGTIPSTSPMIDGDPTEGEYKLYKCGHDDPGITGAEICELQIEEARIIVQSGLFTGSMPSREFIAAELDYSQIIRQEFMATQDSLDLTTADALFTALEPTSHTLSAGSINLAWKRFNASAVDQSIKNMFNPLFYAWFKKYPRDLT